MGSVHESNLSDVGIAPRNQGSQPLAYHLTIWPAIVGELPWGGLLVPPNGQEEPHHSRVKYPHLIMIKTYGTTLFSLCSLCQYPVWSMLFFLWPLKKASSITKLLSHDHCKSLRPDTAGLWWLRPGLGGCGGGVCRGWSIMPVAPLHQDLDEILLGSKSRGEVSHSTQHMPTPLYFNLSHWSHIKT